MKLIVGLGNPGEKYEGTRHNLGFEVLDKLAHRIKNQESRWEHNARLKSDILQQSLILNSHSLQLVLAKPQTFMNNSGIAVSMLTNFFKVAAEDLVVIQDDLDLHLGQIKIRLGGAGAGHHGVESIIERLGTDKFIRIRLGIGNWKTTSSEHGGNSLNVEHFVLEQFLPDEKHVVKQLIKKSIKALEILLEDGMEKAQNQFN